MEGRRVRDHAGAGRTLRAGGPAGRRHDVGAAVAGSVAVALVRHRRLRPARRIVRPRHRYSGRARGGGPLARVRRRRPHHPRGDRPHRPPARMPRRRRVSRGVRRRRRRHAHRRGGRQHPSDEERRGARVSQRAVRHRGRGDRRPARRTVPGSGGVRGAARSRPRRRGRRTGRGRGRDGAGTGPLDRPPVRAHRARRSTAPSSSAICFSTRRRSSRRSPAPDSTRTSTLAAQTRQRLLRRAAEEKTLVIGPLWAAPGAGTIVPSDEPGRWRLVPAA